MPAMRTTTHTTSPFLGHQRQPSMSVLGGCGDDIFCKTSTPQPTRRYPEGVSLYWAFGRTCRMVSSQSVRYVSWWKVQFMTITKLRRRITGLAAAVAFGVGVVSCAAQDQDATDAPQRDMDGVAVTAGANQPAEVNEVDLHFVAMMTPHHQQAVEMSEIILAAD